MWIRSSFYHQQWIDTRRSEFKQNRQTVFFLPIDPRDKGHKDLAKIDFNEPRRAQFLHSAIIFQGILPAYCIPKVVRLKIGEVLFEKSYMSLRPPPKISLRHDHDWTRGNVPLGFTVINSQKLKLFDSHEEKFNTQRSPN